MPRGWFEGPFFYQNQTVILSGEHYCESINGGFNYTCKASVDPYGDYSPDFIGNVGFVGGGIIETGHVSGWVHGTKDGGKTWTQQIGSFPYPILVLKMLTLDYIVVAGGDDYTSVGGIWMSENGGQTWRLELDTGCRMTGLSIVKLNTTAFLVTVAGTSYLEGVIYKSLIILNTN